jgi:hypothetical protein
MSGVGTKQVSPFRQPKGVWLSLLLACWQRAIAS